MLNARPASQLAECPFVDNSAELTRALAIEGVLLIDVRQPEEVERGVAVPNAMNIPHDSITEYVRARFLARPAASSGAWRSHPRTRCAQGPR